MLTDDELAAIEARSSTTLSMPLHSAGYQMLSARLLEADIPTLVAEIRRLREQLQRKETE